MKLCQKNKKVVILPYVFLILLAICFVLPFLALISTSFKTFEDAVTNMTSLIPKSFTFDNYKRAFTEQGILLGLWNSVIISVVSTVGTGLSASLVAYAFARFDVKEKEFIFSILMASTMIPGQVLQISMFALYNDIGWMNTLLPFLIPPFLGGGIMNVFLMRQFMRSIPKALFEAAEIDGASEFRMYVTIAMRISVPILITVGIFTFTGAWNDFMGPLVYLNGAEGKKPLALVMYQMYNTAKIGDMKQWNLISASSVITVLPLIAVFFACQKYFIEGVSVSGIKQ
ncbi:MAG TPA: sugar ABC transporter ATP-binding protein [Clostridiales bacterium]|nr:sugar ABC transporter ATP-binding protein [Clostridiales bacterium]